ARLKSTSSRSMTKVMMSPPTPHVKQWNSPFSTSTDSDGVRSLWKGHNPVPRLPRARNRWTLARKNTAAGGSAERSNLEGDVGIGRAHPMNVLCNDLPVGDDYLPCANFGRIFFLAGSLVFPAARLQLTNDLDKGAFCKRLHLFR